MDRTSMNGIPALVPASAFYAEQFDRFTADSSSTWQRRADIAAAAFPLTRKLLRDRWQHVVEQYWLWHKWESARNKYMLRDFPLFLRFECSEIGEEFPFIADLADYEITRTAVAADQLLFEAGSYSAIDIMRDSLRCGPVVNPTLMFRVYQYPVLQLAEEIRYSNGLNIDATKEWTFVAVYRDPRRDELAVQRTGEVAAAIILHASSEPTSYALLSRNALSQVGDPNSSVLQLKFWQTVARLHLSGIFISTVETS